MCRKLICVSILTLIANPALAQPHARDTSIRKTKWVEYFNHSPDFSIDTAVTDSSLGQFVSINADTAAEGSLSGGYPSVEDVLYGDLIGDNIEEAIMLFFSGGTAGACSFAVIRQTQKGPLLADWGGGYKIGDAIRNDTSLIYQPIYAGWEPNCCPGSLQTRFYRIKNNKLFLTDSTEEGIVDMASNAVEHFYSLLSSRDDTIAYKMLGKKYQSQHPFKKWSEGFKNTISNETVVDTMRKSDSTVHIKLTAVDRSPGGKDITNMYEGTWKLEWKNAVEGWLLTEPKIKRVNKK